MSTTKESGEQRSAEVRWANSQRVYVAGETAGVRVPLREVAPEDDGYLTAGAAEYAQAKTKGRLEYFPGLRRAPLRAKQGRRVTQMHYARRGLITPEMEFIALRENMGREAALETLSGVERDSL